MSKASVCFTLGGLENPHDAKAIKRELDALPGVLSVSVSDSADRVTVDFDATGVQSGRIGKQLEKMGYRISDAEMDKHSM